jgi:hypothetical protein
MSIPGTSIPGTGIPSTGGMERAAASPDYRSPDPLPFRVRVGVTGHLSFDNPAELAEWVKKGLDRIRAELAPAAGTPLAWTVVSSLAEGADRLVTRVVLDQPGSRLEVPLPLPAEEYLADFAEQASRDEFERLLRQAAVVIPAPHFASRDGAYEWASHAMVGRSEVVIALWDGERGRGTGGTADTVEYAHRHGRPVVHIVATGNPGIRVLAATAEGTPESGGQPQRDPFLHLRGALRGVEAYNRVPFDAARLDPATAMADLMSDIDSSPRCAVMWQQIARWVIPHFTKADLLAMRARHRVNFRLALTYLLPFLAITTVAVQSQFLTGSPWVLWIEVAFLLGALAVVALDRLPQLHYPWLGRLLARSHLPPSPQQEWVSYRHLAERLRSAFFLAAIQPEVRTGPAAVDAYLEGKDSELRRLTAAASSIRGFHESAESWLPRLFAEVWQHRPPGTASEQDVPEIRVVLARQWIGGQQRYHADAARRHQRNDRVAATSVVLLFAATALIAGLHAGIGRLGTGTDRAFTTIALVFPALAAVITALTHHFEFRHHRETSAAMSRRLRHAAEVLAKAPDLRTLREDAEAVEGMMISENREWFGLMRLRQLELHA